MIFTSLNQLCEENNLSLKTTELAAQLFQKCFSQKCCNLSNILLIAITSLFISIKYNECSNLTQINLQDCILLGNGNYTEKDFLEMELKILNLINFDVNLPTISDFLQEETIQYVDLVLFVTLDSKFWSFSKLDLFQAILAFANKPKKDQNEITTNVFYSHQYQIMNIIQTKVNMLTAISNDQKTNLKQQRKRIQKQKLRIKKRNQRGFNQNKLDVQI
ncbi:unnamed protein product (macronuclear) [Paramecium tetraurelia]|uniref:Cyclin-like domain-containing protein n=1 Tax=Paramecium tetraurelia TaxID=5888 RepID=A0BCQ7_PARTE|nr:uncharacterized protein GSPATT00004418001 [Paramecium tetraurelia]CAK56324.1 unnamed protein product [Paramecium tetraurelia]|eukprot:XP_001423722.1 hypothetical protein (macronuclear) [Paramecium tetraurelia strain d4-2]